VIRGARLFDGATSKTSWNVAFRTFCWELIVGVTMTKIAQTEQGPIEYRIVGQGSAVLVLNGGHTNMHADVLESARFPEAVFSPDRVIGQLSLEREFQVQVHGVLQIRRQDHQVVFPTKVKIEGDRVMATATFVMPYVRQWCGSAAAVRTRASTRSPDRLRKTSSGERG
jgi:hypothetical protein